MKNKTLVWIGLILVVVVIATKFGESSKTTQGGKSQIGKPSLGDICDRCLSGKSNICGDSQYLASCYYNILPNNNSAFRGCEVTCWPL